MSTTALSYRGYRFPAEIISHAVWLYHRFCLGHRNVEDLLAEGGATVSHLPCLVKGDVRLNDPDIGRRFGSNLARQTLS